MATPPLVARLTPLPVELAPALAARRRSMAAATGRVLDLGEWSDHVDSYRTGHEVEEVVRVDDPCRLAAPGRFDTIVSLVRTPLVANLGDYVHTLLEMLAAEGRTGFLDPVRRPGRLPHELRRLGLIVIDLYRFEVPSVPAPFRPFVEAWARRPVRR